MGTLYLAHDPVLDRGVALKLFHADLDGPEARERFVREARAVAALNHPNIVTIYDYGEYSSQPFLVMEFIDGETLAAIIRRRPVLPTIVKVKWLEDLCSAVGYAHERGIIHRDIKPANLMVDGYGRLKVLDFGIARMRDTMASQTTGLVGTPGYIAPEQIRGARADRRSDVFSIGVVSYELCSFIEPFAAANTLAMSHRILNEEPAPLDAVQETVPGELAALVARALAKDPEQRFETADAMRDSLAGVRRYLEAAEPETVSTFVPQRGTNAGGAPTGSAVSAATGAAGGAAGGSTGGGAPLAPPPAASGVLTPRSTPESPASPHTPLPTPRRTTREALARQREEQLEGWLELAREHLADGEVAEAREACAQALKIEPAHAGALDLLGSIGTDAGRSSRVPNAGRATHPAPSSVEIRRPTPQPESSAKERALPSTPAAPVLTTPPPRPSPLPTPALPTPAPPMPAPTTFEPNPTPAPAVPAPRVSRRGWIGLLAGAAALVMLVAGVLVWIVVRPPAVSAPILVVIDASPWAAIRSITSERGESQELPGDATTPLTLPLTPGSYRISLVGPPPASEARDVSLRVTPNGQSRVFELFASMTADQYLREVVTPRTRPADQKAGPR
jgi:serine/threonine-protein kinase